jgi:50S ribosomal protein L16 3-hydroxylase
MSDFKPTDEWILKPGDMLYLPPGIAHYGVALENCITLSVGFRAPSFADIITAFSDDMASKFTSEQRFTDPDLQLQQHPGEISVDALSKIHTIIQSICSDKTAIKKWFGRYITEPRSTESSLEPEIKLSTEEFLNRFREYGQIVRNEYTRFAFISQSDACLLFIDGQEFLLPTDIAFVAPLLCDQRILQYEELENNFTRNDFTSLLTKLYNAGYVTFIE